MFEFLDTSMDLYFGRTIEPFRSPDAVIAEEQARLRWEKYGIPPEGGYRWYKDESHSAKPARTGAHL